MYFEVRSQAGGKRDRQKAGGEIPWLSGEALRKLERDEAVVATIKVSQKGYVPSGVEVRAQISPLIFTANIPHEVLAQLEQDPAVVAIEPLSNLRSY